MRILFQGINYAPESIGIGPYSRGLCEWLAAVGHAVRAVVAKPYYPSWKVTKEFAGGGEAHSVENGVKIVRCPLYVPQTPTGAKRILHHLSFAVSAFRPMRKAAREFRPDVVLTVAPSLIAAPVALLAARRAGAVSWLHIQDFEVEAAFATGLLDSSSLIARAARKFERYTIARFDWVSSISPEMCRKLAEIGVEEDRIFELRNWAEIEQIQPLSRPSLYREKWGITTPHVALYSGNIANKQGIEIVLEAAELLRRRDDLTFVVCGQGPNRATLEEKSRGLNNIRFYDLQPAELLDELLGIASVHLLPQKADAADLVLPSKLTNMLSSGRPVVATAALGTGLEREVRGCGLVTPPEQAGPFAAAIEQLIDDIELSAHFSGEARARAEEIWDRTRILERFEARLRALGH